MKPTACPALVVNIDCASPKLTRSDSTYKSGNSVQTNGATSEGIETRSDWNLLRELGCSIAQGYFIAKPLPALQFIEWVQNWAAP